VILAVVLCAISASMRCLVFFHPTKWYSIWCIHIAQILNAAVGPFVMASPSKLSSNWFPVKERTTATAVATLSNSLGGAVGFLIGPYIVKWYNIQVLLVVEGIHAVIIMIATLCYFPDRPPTPPSASAGSVENVHFGRELLALMKNRYFMLLVLIGGWQAGAFNAWSGMFAIILTPEGYSETLAGWLGFLTIVSGVGGGLLVGILGDSIFKRKFKLMLVTLFFLCSLTLVWFTISLPSLISRHPLIRNNEGTIITSITLAGLFLGSTNPLFYELSAEMTYPVTEGSSAGILTLVNNLACVIVLGIGPFINVNWINTLVVISIIGCGILLLPIKEEYRRSDVDDNPKGIQ